MANHYQVTKVINGKEYVAQFAGLSVALNATDETYIDGSGNTSMIKLAEYLFEHVIVEPKGLKVDDFEDMDEFKAVIKFANDVMSNKFRKEANQDAAKAAGKK